MASRTPRTSDNSGCTAERRISKRAPGTASRGACKTCTHCRQKKVRCDGGRPQCHACIANGQECDYPQDGRRYARASPAKVQSLEAGLAVLWGQMKALGVLRADADLPEVLHSDPHFHGQQQTPGPGPGPDFDELPAPQSLPATNAVASLPVARLLLAPQTGTQTQTHVPCDDGASQWAPPAAGHGVYHGPAQGEQPEPVTHAPHSDINDPTDTMLNEAEPEADKELEETSLSPSEARVAGVSQHDEGRLYVHGLSSILTPNPPPIPIGSRTRRLPVRETSTAAAKARLVSNAALQRQREACLFRGPRNTLDLDGVDVEMARHLLDLHWNRQHYAYLLTYRPAIMDSLAHGGPWANKLLLNAIFYSSCLYSDRPCLRLDPGDPQSAGLRFYTRFRQLLGDAMVESSIPSAVALLLCGATLVSQGRSSAGWALCGTAYRMITDMGVHLTLEPAAAPGDVSSSRNLHSDIEREMRKRLYWGAFITDATQSLYLGRPPALVLAEARVPQLLLDTFEELEDWAPYIDYMAPSPQDALLRSYSPRPAHAVSTFQAMARLFTVSSRMSREIYGIDTVKQPGENLVAARDSIDRQLEQWRSALPAHLRFDPDVDPVVPPHQITPQ
ncbi:hypothetical protein SBRCBS47491_009287 [Sporothrix bragantina]|uniref:Zn(2)-C6 fungal-type domain-containing protein n=1 Tax=Sporothrix bragantina TaxID=671064 RepID=A0ABP0CTG1_9PEZI